MISTTMTAIATVIPITKWSAPFTYEPVGSGMLVEDRNGPGIVGTIAKMKISSCKYSFRAQLEVHPR